LLGILLVAVLVVASDVCRPDTAPRKCREVRLISGTHRLGACQCLRTCSACRIRRAVPCATRRLTALSPEIAIVGWFCAVWCEETLWRFFLFLVVAWAFTHLLRSHRASLVIGPVVPTFFLRLIHPGFWSEFLIGLALVYIYYHGGLLPAMIVHFFTDAIPFTLVSLLA
jgi:hypothetical protein